MFHCPCVNKYFRESGVKVRLGTYQNHELYAQSCVDIDECAEGTDNCNATKHEKCHNLIGKGFECVCESGYHKENGVCVEVCGEKSCSGHGKCTPVGENDFKCVCEAGFY